MQFKTRLELQKQLVFLRANGTQYEFFRQADNGYGGKTPEAAPVCTLNALYHEVFSYVQENISDGAIVRQANSVRHKECFLLCLLEDTGLIKQGDWVMIGQTKYFVHSVSNLTELSIMAEISLRPQDDGTNNQY